MKKKVMLSLMLAICCIFCSFQPVSAVLDEEAAESLEALEILSKDMVTGEVYEEEFVINPNVRVSEVKPANMPAPLLDENGFGITPYAVIGTDERREVASGDVTNYVKALCYIEAYFPYGDPQRGTAFVVGKDVLLTAAHCLYNAKQGGYATSVKVYPQRRGSNCYGGTYTARYLHVTNNYVYVTPSYGQYDIGIIRLGTNLEAKTGSYGLTYTDAYNTLKGLNITVAGYPGDITNEIRQYTSTGTITGTASYQDPGDKRYYGRILHNVDTGGGQSGAAIHTTGFLARGIHVGGYDNQFNFGCAINKVFYNWIMQYVNAF